MVIKKINDFHDLSHAYAICRETLGNVSLCQTSTSYAYASSSPYSDNIWTGTSARIENVYRYNYNITYYNYNFCFTFSSSATLNQPQSVYGKFGDTLIITDQGLCIAHNSKINKRSSE